MVIGILDLYMSVSRFWNFMVIFGWHSINGNWTVICSVAQYWKLWKFYFWFAFHTGLLDWYMFGALYPHFFQFKFLFRKIERFIYQLWYSMYVEQKNFVSTNKKLLGDVKL